jgi:hypothetical protein
MQLAPLGRTEHYKDPKELRAGKNDRCSMRYVLNFPFPPDTHLNNRLFKQLLDIDIVLIPTLKS